MIVANPLKVLLSLVLGREHQSFPEFHLGDFGNDPDDTLKQIHGGFFTMSGLARLEGTVANVAPADMRARLTKGVYKTIGLPNIPVGIGTAGGHKEATAESNTLQSVIDFPRNTRLTRALLNHLWKRNTAVGDDILNQYDLTPEAVKPYDFRFDPRILADAHEVERDGGALFYRALCSKEVPEKSLKLILTGSMTDAANWLRNYTDKFIEKVGVVAMMGGVKVENGVVFKDSDGYMVPDEQAQNNKYDMPSSEYLHRMLQEHNIPFIGLRKEAAYAAKVPKYAFNELAATNHPVGIYLKEMQEEAIQYLWLRSHLAGDDPGREGLPGPCSAAWFVKTFCENNPEAAKLNGWDEIWNHIIEFAWYDVMTGLSAIERMMEIFFEPTIVRVNNTDHKILGVTEQNHGVKDPSANLVEFMVNAICTTLVLANAPGIRLNRVANG